MASSCCCPEYRGRVWRLQRRLESLQDGGGDDVTLLKAIAALQKLSDWCKETSLTTDHAECSALTTDHAECSALTTDHAECPALNVDRTECQALTTDHAECPALNADRTECLAQNVDRAECPALKVECQVLNVDCTVCPALNADRAECPAQNADRAECPAQNADHAECPAQNADHAECPAQNEDHAECPAQNEDHAECPAQNADHVECPALNVDLAEFLALYTQALLDVTYCEESRLVEAEFPGDDSLQPVRELVQLLSEPESLSQDVVLDIEVQECLHWRRGALLYMYCHTVGDRERWELRHPGTFHQCLQDGVHYLLKMLQMRSPVQLDDQVLFRDINTAALLEKGVFSDVHILALMYCGEMCYWAQRYCRDAEQTSQRRADPEPPSQDLPFRDIGEKVLDTYVGVCEGPLRGQRWSTDNARKILQYLKGDL